MTEHSQSGSILGTRVKRVEDDSLLRGRGTFVENLELPGAAHLAFVRCGPTPSFGVSTRPMLWTRRAWWP